MKKQNYQQHFPFFLVFAVLQSSRSFRSFATVPVPPAGSVSRSVGSSAACTVSSPKFRRKRCFHLIGSVSRSVGSSAACAVFSPKFRRKRCFHLIVHVDIILHDGGDCDGQLYGYQVLNGVETEPCRRLGRLS